jgi:RNA 2',3'-cyclic 3'-phosphodiesterase
VRLFVALNLNDEVRAAIDQFCDKLRLEFPSARWVRTEGIHVTLKFIGEVASDVRPRIESALGNVHSDAPVEMMFRGTGFFPDARRPRVCWAGIDASPNLADVAAQVESQLEPLGIARESREFKPHLTLARIPETRGIEKLHDALRKLGPADFGMVRTNEMHLFQSELVRGGAKYTCLKTFTFSGQNR